MRNDARAAGDATAAGQFETGRTSRLETFTPLGVYGDCRVSIGNGGMPAVTGHSLSVKV